MLFLEYTFRSINISKSKKVHKGLFIFLCLPQRKLNTSLNTSNADFQLYVEDIYFQISDFICFTLQMDNEPKACLESNLRVF